VISGFCHKVAESCTVLVYDTASSGKFFTTTHRELTQKERSSHIPLQQNNKKCNPSGVNGTTQQE